MSTITFEKQNQKNQQTKNFGLYQLEVVPVSIFLCSVITL